MINSMINFVNNSMIKSMNNWEHFEIFYFNFNKISTTTLRANIPRTDEIAAAMPSQ